MHLFEILLPLTCCRWCGLVLGQPDPMDLTSLPAPQGVYRTRASGRWCLSYGAEPPP